MLGNIPDWDIIKEVADRHGLLIIEDLRILLEEL